ncbi:GlsB/YeaQ/YmgE family stress response membrane protein [Staphylococcus sp. AS1337]|uniref:GlsB/YeaQ/YmgE family stress response membrane protein n=1 Tax=Staphylococcus sp. AS1337 TaxID=3434042 RepID=UPI003F5707CD
MFFNNKFSCFRFYYLSRNIIAGLIGSAIGSKLLGTWGPVLGGVPILPALIGAIVLILIVSIVMKAIRK